MQRDPEQNGGAFVFVFAHREQRLKLECLQCLQLPSNFTASHCKTENLTHDTAAIRTSVAPGDRQIQGKWNVNLFRNILCVNSALTTELARKLITPPSSTSKAVPTRRSLLLLATCIYVPLTHLCPTQHSYSSKQNFNIHEQISFYIIQSTGIWPFFCCIIRVFSKAVCPMPKIRSVDYPTPATGSAPYATYDRPYNTLRN
jgi:hypothetical protein